MRAVTVNQNSEVTDGQKNNELKLYKTPFGL